jgi:formiminotetrahydrofolate cyclodeaminase
VPLRVAQVAGEIATLVSGLRSRTNPRMGSDLTVAASLARAAAEGALANVEINLEAFEAGTEADFVTETRSDIAAVRNLLG